MASPLTSGAAEHLQLSPEPPTSDIHFQPVLQLLSVKPIASQAAQQAQSGGKEQLTRYRLILSDGAYYCQAMLSTQLNSLVEDGTLDKHRIVKLTSFACNAVQNRRLIVVLGIEVVPWSGEGKIGEPKSVSDGAQAAQQAPKVESQQKPAAPVAVSGGFSAGRGGKAGGGASRGGAGGGRGGPQGPLFPIEGLSPYQNKWTIKARVINRSDIKHWSNQRGEGKLFSVTLMDESGEIRATGFNEAVDNFYELLQEGKVFYISRARVNIAKKQFNNVNNEYELTLDNNSEIEPCGDDEAVPQIKYAFVPLDQLGAHEKDSTIDVIAVVKDVAELGSITSKATQKPFSKRDITLVDTSMHSVRLTLWGKQAEAFSGDDSPVIAFKGVKLGDFGGRSLSMFSSSTMSVNPDIPEAHMLRGWFDSDGRNASFQAYSNTGMTATGAGATAGGVRPEEVKTIGEVKDTGMGTNEKPDYFTCKATINFIKNDTFAYPACDSEGCSKKVVDIGDGWRCEKCEKTIAQPNYRYILNVSIMDHTGHIWVTAFNEIGEAILGKDANEMTALKENDSKLAEEVFAAAQSQTFQFQCSAKQDNFNDQARIRYTVRRAIPLDYKAECHALIKAIEAM